MRSRTHMRPTSTLMRSFSIALAGALVSLCLFATPASAVINACNFSGDTVSINATANNDSVGFRVGPSGEIMVASSAATAYTFPALPPLGAYAQCSTATTSNTNTIRVTQAGSRTNNGVVIDLSGGAFSTGADEVGDASAEVEFDITGGAGTGDNLYIVGSTGADNILFGVATTSVCAGTTALTTGVNLNADEGGTVDCDVTPAAFENYAVFGGVGADTISAAGGGVFDAAFPGFASIVQFDGGDGNDTITGGNAADTLTGGANDDALNGGFGNDTENGGTENDTFFQEACSNGNDLMNGNAGTDTADYSARAGVGNAVDVNTQGTADDGKTAGTVVAGCTVSTAETDDVELDVENVTGSDQADTLVAPTTGTVANVFTGGAGADTMSPGAANDIFAEGASANGGDIMNGGAGSDTVDYSARTNPITVTLAAGAANDGESGEADDIGGTSTPVTDVENVTGGSGNDSITGDTNAGAGAETLVGNGGDDTLTASPAADTLSGGAGDDTLDGSTGSDTENGGAGFDTFNQGAVTNGSDTLTGDGDEDVVNYSSRTATITVTIGAGANDGLSGENDNVQTEDVNGSNTAVDNITGDAGRNIIDGGSGNVADNLNGGAGRDFLIGGPGGDSLAGGTGRDTAVYSTSAAGVTINLTVGTAQGGAGDGTGDVLSSILNVIGSDNGVDNITGDGNDNTLNGGAGNDNLTGGGGADTLLGRGGADTLAGGAGNDDLSPGAGTDTDVVIGGAGERDTVDYSQCAAGVTVDLTNGGTGTEGGGNGNADATGNQDTGCGSDDLTSIDNVRGTAFTDTLTGDGEINALFGLGASDGSDADTLNGGGGGDTLSGGRGNDILNGGNGGDLIKGGAGNDTAHGDANDDVVQGGDGDDVLYGDNGDDNVDGEAGSDQCAGETEANCESDPP